MTDGDGDQVLGKKTSGFNIPQDPTQMVKLRKVCLVASLVFMLAPIALFYLEIAGISTLTQTYHVCTYIRIVTGIWVITIPLFLFGWLFPPGELDDGYSMLVGILIAILLFQVPIALLLWDCSSFLIFE